MLVVLIGPQSSGRSSIADYLVASEGFTHVTIGDSRPPAKCVNSRAKDPLAFSSAGRFLDFATLNWRNHYVTTHALTRDEAQSFRKRPWVLLVSVEAPLLWRFERHVQRAQEENEDARSLADFVRADDVRIHGHIAAASSFTTDSRHLQLPSGPFSLPEARPTPPGTPSKEPSALPMEIHSSEEGMPLADLLPMVNLTVRPAAFQTLEALHQHLARLNLTDDQRVRPSWDDYFMTLAELASLRSNCMKRRVGAVLISSTRKVVISTGYNGTPRGMPNCSDGGCQRCNSASKFATGDSTEQPVRSGMEMEECLCLHAEENALLEAGRERAGAGEGGGTLYCNTCPCLRCTVKIVQCGVREVVYSKSYSMDSNSAYVFERAGVRLRQIALKSH